MLISFIGKKIDMEKKSCETTRPTLYCQKVNYLHGFLGHKEYSIRLDESKSSKFRVRRVFKGKVIKFGTLFLAKTQPFKQPHKPVKITME